jgi:hypothetical protein
MISLINPFRGITETSTSPHARTLRTGLWQKIKDTFFVFAGDFDISNRHQGIHVGLFDYPLLGIFFVLQGFLIAFIRNEIEVKNPILRGILGFFLVVLNIPLMTARYATAAVITLISLPIVTIVHLTSLILASTQKERILRLPVTLNVVTMAPGQPLKKSQEEQTIGRYLQNNDISIEDVAILNVLMPDSENNTSKTLKLEFYRKPSFVSSNIASVDNTAKVAFSYSTLFPPAEAVKKDIQALIDLNIGGVTANLEKTPDRLDFLQMNCR